MAEPGEEGAPAKRRRVEGGPCHIQRASSKLLSRLWSSSMLSGDDGGRDVTVMTWNLQADGMKHAVADPAYEVHPTRFEFALEEITRIAPDVLCLQEINHYHRKDRKEGDPSDFFWEEQLAALGYVGDFIPKYEHGKVPSYYNGAPSDGCSLHVRECSGLKIKDGKCWKHNVRDLLHECPEDVIVDATTKELKSFGWHKENPNVVITAEVQDAQTGRTLFVASNTHKTAGNPKDEERKQQRQAHAQCWAKFMKKTFHGTPLVMCGDMNEEKDEKAVRHLVTALGLCCAHEVALGKHLPYTTKHHHGGDLSVDHILLTKPSDHHGGDLSVSPSLSVVKVFCVPETLPPEVLKRKCLLSEYYPSDHLALATVIRIGA